MVMKRLSEYLFFWTLGGTLYYSFEMIFRGFSHWSMFMLGGFCLVFCIQQGIWTGWDSPLWLQVLWCSVFVTTGEFITGILVNKVMHWHVWDYSDQPFQLMGQICIPFAVLFSGLCVVGIFLGLSTARIRYTIKYLKDGLIIFTQKERKGTMQTKDSEEVVARFGAKLI